MEDKGYFGLAELPDYDNGAAQPSIDPKQFTSPFDGTVEELVNQVPRVSGALQYTGGLAFAGLLDQNEKSQDWIFHNVVDPALARIKSVDENSETNGYAAQKIGGFAGAAAEVAAGGPEALGLISGIERAGQETAAGTNVNESMILGAMEGSENAAMALIGVKTPVAKGLGPAVIQRALTGAGVSAGIAEAENKGEKLVREAYQDQTPTPDVNLLSAALIGAAFPVVHFAGEKVGELFQKKQAPVPGPVLDAAMVNLDNYDAGQVAKGAADVTDGRNFVEDAKNRLNQGENIMDVVQDVPPITPEAETAAREAFTEGRELLTPEPPPKAPMTVEQPVQPEPPAEGKTIVGRTAPISDEPVAKGDEMVSDTSVGPRKVIEGFDVPSLADSLNDGSVIIQRGWDPVIKDGPLEGYNRLAALVEHEAVEREAIKTHGLDYSDAHYNYAEPAEHRVLLKDLGLEEGTPEAKEAIQHYEDSYKQEIQDARDRVQDPENLKIHPDMEIKPFESPHNKLDKEAYQDVLDAQKRGAEFQEQKKASRIVDSSPEGRVAGELSELGLKLKDLYGNDIDPIDALSEDVSAQEDLIETAATCILGVFGG